MLCSYLGHSSLIVNHWVFHPCAGLFLWQTLIQIQVKIKLVRFITYLIKIKVFLYYLIVFKQPTQGLLVEIINRTSALHFAVERQILLFWYSVAHGHIHNDCLCSPLSCPFFLIEKSGMQHRRSHPCLQANTQPTTVSVKSFHRCRQFVFPRLMSSFLK